MGIEIKSTAQLIDELAIVNIRCWFAQEDVMKGGDDAFVAKVARKAQQLNAKRNALVRAIDERLGNAETTPDEKSYATNENDNK